MLRRRNIPNTIGCLWRGKAAHCFQSNLNDTVLHTRKRVHACSSCYCVTDVIL